MRGDVPSVPERVENDPGAITVELVGNRPDDFGTQLHCSGDDRIGVLNIDMEADWRTAKDFRAAITHLRNFIRKHHDGIAQFDLRVADLAAGHVES